VPAADAKTFFSFGRGRRYIYFLRPADHAHRNLRLLIENWTASQPMENVGN